MTISEKYFELAKTISGVMVGSIAVGGAVYYSTKYYSDSNERIAKEKREAEMQLALETVKKAFKTKQIEIENALKVKQLEILMPQVKEIAAKLECGIGTQPTVRIGYDNLPEATCASIGIQNKKEVLAFRMDCFQLLHKLCDMHGSDYKANLDCGTMDCGNYRHTDKSGFFPMQQPEVINFLNGITTLEMDCIQKLHTICNANEQSNASNVDKVNISCGEMECVSHNYTLHNDFFEIIGLAMSENRL